MPNERKLYLGFSALSILGSVLADTAIVVDGQDQSIQYHTVQNGDMNATWTRVGRAPDSCDSPQMLTSNLGDYMTFSFSGTGIQVVGTKGKKRGIIIFTLDGQNVTFDRSNQQLICDAVLFEHHNLPFSVHTIVATLVGKDINFSSGVLDGILPIQRVRYYIPGEESSSKLIAPIISVMVAVLILIAASGSTYYLWRKRHQEHQKRNRSASSRDNNDISSEEYLMDPLSRHSTRSIRSRNPVPVS